MRLERISVMLWPDDLALLRALYRDTHGGYSVHIRAALRGMCNDLRERLSQTEQGRRLLRELGQTPPDPA